MSHRDGPTADPTCARERLGRTVAPDTTIDLLFGPVFHRTAVLAQPIHDACVDDLVTSVLGPRE